MVEIDKDPDPANLCRSGSGSTLHTDKKENKIFLMHMEIHSQMRRPLVLYDFSTTPFWISLYMRKILFSFLSVHNLPGLRIRNYLFWIRLRTRIRLLRKFRLRIQILFRIRQRWSPPRESCAVTKLMFFYLKLFREIFWGKKVFISFNRAFG